MIILIIAIEVFSFRFANRLGLEVIWRSTFAFYLYAIAVLVVVSWIVSWASISVLRLVFRLTGMMNRGEAQSFPLRADKKCVDPWPESWQKLSTYRSDDCAARKIAVLDNMKSVAPNGQSVDRTRD